MNKRLADIFLLDVIILIASSIFGIDGISAALVGVFLIDAIILKG